MSNQVSKPKMPIIAISPTPPVEPEPPEPPEPSEPIPYGDKLAIIANRCIGCGKCITVCIANAISDNYVINNDECVKCRKLYFYMSCISHRVGIVL